MIKKINKNDIPFLIKQLCFCPSCSSRDHNYFYDDKNNIFLVKDIYNTRYFNEHGFSRLDSPVSNHHAFAINGEFFFHLVSLQVKQVI